MNKGKLLIPGAREVFEELRDAGVRWLFISNNATALPAELAAGIRDLGIAAADDQVVNSIHVCWWWENHHWNRGCGQPA